MLNFRTASILFIIACAGVISLHYSIGISWWWLVPVTLIYKIRILTGSASISSNFYIQAHCNGTTTEKEIALTFDDGPTGFTQKIMSTLAEHQAAATFFVIGKNIRGNETIVKQIVSEGHTIGNHTFSHSFFIDFKSATAFKEELNQTADAIYNVTGKRTQFFRPPYGVTTPNLAKAAKVLNYKIIGWNIRSLDTTKDSEEIIFNRVKEQLKPGAIILFHDTSDKTNNVLKQTLSYARENGFKVVGLEQLLQLKAYHG
jgi:peptidoglycan/xylan/chitin deacetylase (PgdA/CDA1 family)